MSYQVAYGSEEEKVKNRKRKSMLFPLTLLFLFCFFLLVKLCWPEGQAVLAKYVMPREAAVMAAAFDDFAAGIQEGEWFLGAFQIFCQEVMEGAKAYFR